VGISGSSARRGITFAAAASCARRAKDLGRSGLSSTAFFSAFSVGGDGLL